jgi:ATP-dependent helicase/DNAse subunit B
MPLVLLGRYRDLASAVAERLASAESPLEGIVASSGVRSAVLAELLRRTPSGVASARLDGIDAFARRIVNETGDYPRMANDGERRLAMRTAVRSVDDPILESRGVAAMLERSYRDVRDSGLSLDELEGRARGTRSLRNRTRTQLVIRVWREYERLIRTLGCIDPADLLGRAARVISQRPAEGAASPRIVVAGFYDMTGAQLHLIEALRARDRLETIFIPATDDENYAFAEALIGRFSNDQESEGERTSGLSSESASSGLRPPSPPRGGEEGEAKVRYVLEAHRTATDELRAVAAEIAGLLASGVSPGAIGIVSRSLDPHDVDLINRMAAERGFTTTATDELPLRAHRIGRGIATLLRLRERAYPRNDVFELLRGGLRTQRALDVDRADFETRRARIAGGTSDELATLSKRSIVDDYIRIVAELEAITAPLAAPMTGNEWAAFLTRATSLFRVETQQDLDALDAFDEIANLMRGANTWNTRFDLTTIEDAIAQHSLQQPGNPATQQPVKVWAGDVMRMRGRTFAHLFAVRMQDDVFPQRRVDDPLLPDMDRRALGLREIGDGRDEERLLFELLLDSAADTIRFTFAGGDGFGKALRPSQLLKAFAVEHEPERKVALLKDFVGQCTRKTDEAVVEGATGPSPFALRPSSLRQLQYLAKTGTGSPFDGYLTTAAALQPHLTRILQAVSPTQLEDFGECPQKFLMKHVLGAVDIDHPERELQMHHRDKGTLDHGILERFYRGGDLSRERLHAIIDEEFDRLEAQSPPFNRTWREIERRATKRTLAQFVKSDLEELEKLGLEPKHFEYRFGTRYAARGGADHAEPFVLDAHGIALRVEGRIDRIDADSSGGDTLRIVDYKSGKAARHKDLGGKIDRGVRLQLALYAMAVASFFERGADSIHGAIKPLVLGGIKSEKFAFCLDEKAPRLTETLDLFARSILSGRFPAFPAEDDDNDINACRYCPVAHSCRTRHDMAERYAVLKWKEPRALLEGLPQ